MALYCLSSCLSVLMGRDTNTVASCDCLVKVFNSSPQNAWCRWLTHTGSSANTLFPSFLNHSWADCSLEIHFGINLPFPTELDMDIYLFLFLCQGNRNLHYKNSWTVSQSFNPLSHNLWMSTNTIIQIYWTNLDHLGWLMCFASRQMAVNKSKIESRCFSDKLVCRYSGTFHRTGGLCSLKKSVGFTP